MPVSINRRATRIAAVVVFALVALVVAMSLAGCTKTLDTKKAEAEIKKGIEQQAGVTMKSVDCPDDVTAKKGDTFECTAVAENGTKAPVKVSQTDDKGNITWELNPGK